MDFKIKDNLRQGKQPLNQIAMICPSEVTVITESKRKFHQEGQGSAGNGQASSSWPYHRAQISSEGKVLKGTKPMIMEKVEQIHERLANLEEETQMMKQELLQSLAERKTLLNDVYQQLKVLESSLHPQDEIFRCKFCKEGRMKSDGLSEILFEDPNPSLVVRGLRANTVAVLDPAQSFHFACR